MEGAGVTIGFWTLSVVTLGSAGGVLVARNLLHAILFLIVSFIGVAGFFLMLSAEFLAMVQVLIYVGAITVLILFAIFLTPLAGRDNAETKMLAPAAMLAVALAAVFIFVIWETDWSVVAADPGAEALGTGELGRALLSTWALPFELAAVLLTAALIGAVMLARSNEEEQEDLGE